MSDKDGEDGFLFCKCGCGQQTSGPKRIFLQGHWMKTEYGKKHMRYNNYRGAKPTTVMATFQWFQ